LPSELFADNVELLEALKEVIRLKDLIEYDSTIVTQCNESEAIALSMMIQKLEELISKLSSK